MLLYPHLFTPIKLGSTTFRNRLFASPISGRSLDERHVPNPECTAFYERKAIGGAASVCLGDGVVDTQNGLFGEYMVHLDDPLTGYQLNRFTHAIARHGAVASVELQHGGLYSKYSRALGGTVYGPVAGEDADGNAYFEMPEEVILQTVEKFAAAAAWAKQCGFGMVTVHGGHGWLLSQFLSSKVNTRRDRWGGAFENRMRLPLAILDAIRRAVGPGFPIEIRISGSEVTERGYGLDEGIAIAKALDGHVDLIHVSAGHHEHTEVFTVTHPSIFSGDSCNIVYAAEIKKHVKTPVASVGAHCDPALLEELVASGKADVIEMARALLADPDLPKKARAGEPEKIRPCLRCLSCFSGLITNGQIYCAVNPEIGNELEYRPARQKTAPKTVLIAGGGIGGMQAAITCAENGHRVVLCEKSGRLGGALKCEENVPFKKKVRDYIAYQTKLVEKLPIDVRLNTEATPELAASLAPDAIIAATGARPVKPRIEGIDGENVFSAEEIYENPARAGKRVAVLGGGLVGVELAIYLAQSGREVTLVEMLPFLNNGGNILHQFALDAELQKNSVALKLGARALEIDASGVRCDAGLVDADTVIYAVGQAPSSADALREYAPEFYQIGDCVTPKNITQTTATADAAAREIG
ncbi:MAG: NAD(P)/FAD-dependent oxidoreductase [Oscillospiraceae bacterium]|jgi:2,4-dienoyl-CoA reductase-like NADH-dependent reductase (Old Yellow Enzyme family)/thioredoxin reductase|nr:NAD(P)/FAD-dependent oxidoreductase [Oscillospiraceae bacterium]